MYSMVATQQQCRHKEVARVRLLSMLARSSHCAQLLRMVTEAMRCTELPPRGSICHSTVARQHAAKLPYRSHGELHDGRHDIAVGRLECPDSLGLGHTRLCSNKAHAHGTAPMETSHGFKPYTAVYASTLKVEGATSACQHWHAHSI